MAAPYSPTSSRNRRRPGPTPRLSARRRLTIPLGYVMVAMVTCLPVWVQGGSRMIEPPVRASLWRYGFGTPANFNDDQVDCGGFDRHHGVNQGKCGVCGDPWDEAPPRKYEAGSYFTRKPRPVRVYPTGGDIYVAVDSTAGLLGRYEFRLCPLSSSDVTPDQGCFDRWPLSIRESALGRHYRIGQSGGLASLTLVLPVNLTCGHCLLQWRHVTGHRKGKGGCVQCGPASRPRCTYCLGCGQQNWYQGCADIAIIDTHGTNPVVRGPRSEGGVKSARDGGVKAVRESCPCPSEGGGESRSAKETINPWPPSPPPPVSLAFLLATSPTPVTWGTAAPIAVHHHGHPSSDIPQESATPIADKHHGHPSSDIPQESATPISAHHHDHPSSDIPQESAAPIADKHHDHPGSDIPQESATPISVHHHDHPSSDIPQESATPIADHHHNHPSSDVAQESAVPIRVHHPGSDIPQGSATPIADKHHDHPSSDVAQESAVPIRVHHPGSDIPQESATPITDKHHDHPSSDIPQELAAPIAVQHYDHPSSDIPQELAAPIAVQHYDHPSSDIPQGSATPIADHHHDHPSSDIPQELAAPIAVQHYDHPSSDIPQGSATPIADHHHDHPSSYIPQESAAPIAVHQHDHPSSDIPQGSGTLLQAQHNSSSANHGASARLAGFTFGQWYTHDSDVQSGWSGASVEPLTNTSTHSESVSADHSLYSLAALAKRSATTVQPPLTSTSQAASSNLTDSLSETTSVDSRMANQTQPPANQTPVASLNPADLTVSTVHNTSSEMAIQASANASAQVDAASNNQTELNSAEAQEHESGTTTQPQPRATMPAISALLNQTDSNITKQSNSASVNQIDLNITKQSAYVHQTDLNITKQADSASANQTDVYTPETTNKSSVTTTNYSNSTIQAQPAFSNQSHFHSTEVQDGETMPLATNGSDILGDQRAMTQPGLQSPDAPMVSSDTFINATPISTPPDQTPTINASTPSPGTPSNSSDGNDIEKPEMEANHQPANHPSIHSPDTLVGGEGAPINVQQNYPTSGGSTTGSGTPIHPPAPSISQTDRHHNVQPKTYPSEQTAPSGWSGTATNAQRDPGWTHPSEQTAPSGWPGTATNAQRDPSWTHPSDQTAPSGWSGTATNAQRDPRFQRNPSPGMYHHVYLPARRADPSQVMNPGEVRQGSAVPKLDSPARFSKPAWPDTLAHRPHPNPAVHRVQTGAGRTGSMSSGSGGIFGGSGSTVGGTGSSRLERPQLFSDPRLLPQQPLELVSGICYIAHRPPPHVGQPERWCRSHCPGAGGSVCHYGACRPVPCGQLPPSSAVDTRHSDGGSASRWLVQWLMDAFDLS